VTGSRAAELPACQEAIIKHWACAPARSHDNRRMDKAFFFRSGGIAKALEIFVSSTSSRVFA